MWYNQVTNQKKRGKVMKFTLKTFILFVLTICLVLPTFMLCACDNGSGNGDDTTTAADEQTTAGDNTDGTTSSGEAENPETPAVDVDQLIASQQGPIKDGARMLVVGNSYVHYGKCVTGQGKTVLTQESRENNKGYLYQICKQNGIEVNVTNWTFGGHGLSDFFGGTCTNAGDCFGKDHESYLINEYFDYVILSPSSGLFSDLGMMEHFEYIIKKFKAVNPDVKIVCLGNLGARGYSSWMEVVPGILGNYKHLEEMGVIIADWGGIVNSIIEGTYKVPGATQQYNNRTFVVNDGFHPNLLSGYITALTAYCAITGEKAEGQPYKFATDTSLSSAFNVSSYISSNYDASFTTNFDKVLASDTDMVGIQQLVDKYLTEKPYRDLPDYTRPADFEDDNSAQKLIDGAKVIFIGNIYLSNGRAVTVHEKTDLTQESRTIDKGYFTYLCRYYGSRVDVTNWTWDSHGLSDLFGGACTKSGSCKGIHHEDYLVDRNFDYVVVSPGSSEASETNFLKDFEYIMNFFKAANPNVKFICVGNLGAYGYSSYGVKRNGILSNYKTLEDKGVMIADFGGLIDGIITGKTSVPGAKYTYNNMSFLTADGYNVNPLTGYITTLMVYCAITGEKAEGKVFSIWDNRSLNRNHVTSTYLKNHYSGATTNFDKILYSKEDVRGIQQLIDQYMAQKPWRN